MTETLWKDIDNALDALAMAQAYLESALMKKITTRTEQRLNTVLDQFATIAAQLCNGKSNPAQGHDRSH